MHISVVEVANDELFGQFCGALERVHFFNPTTAGDDDHVRLSKAKHMFDVALIVRKSFMLLVGLIYGALSALCLFLIAYSKPRV